MSNCLFENSPIIAEFSPDLACNVASGFLTGPPGQDGAGGVGGSAGVSSFNTRTGAVVLSSNDVLTALGFTPATLASPAFTGTPTAPTAAPGTNSTQLATTAFVQSALSGASAGVTLFNGRAGAVTLTSGDVLSALGYTPAGLASPAFVGAPTAPTAANGTSTTQLATTAFVAAAVASVTSGVSSFNGRTGAVTPQSGDYSAFYAPISHAHAQSDVAGLVAALAAKEATIAAGTTAQYWRGDKTWQALNASAVGLGSVPDVDATNAANITSGVLPDARISSTWASKAYADALVIGLLDDRGNYNASGNVFPSSGGSGSAGAILKGDLWTVSVSGTLGGVGVTSGDVVRALVDAPGQTAGNWAIGENNFGYVALNQALADGQIYVGNASGIGTARMLSGDVTVDNAGVTAIGSLKVTNAMLAGAIANAKLANSSISIAGTSTSLGGSITASAILDSIGATQGQILYRNATGWAILAPGTSGQVLQSGGAAANPSWTNASGGSVASVFGRTGIVTAQSNDYTFAQIGSKPTTLAGYGITDAQALDADLTAIAALAGTSGLLRKTAADTWALDTASYLTGNQSITISGDGSGTGATAITLTLANSGVTAGTYTKITVDSKGRAIIGASLVAGDLPTHNQAWSGVTGTPTTLAGYGITDAAAASHVHTFASLTSKPTTLSGYGITDAQALDADLTAIAALAGTSGLLRKTAADTWTLDTASYKEKLTANRTYYVRTDGSNSNTGLSNTSGGAFLTLQKAYDTIVQTLDTAGYTVTIKVADGTYTAGINASISANTTVTVEGNTTTPANCLLSVSSANIFTAAYGATLFIKGFKGTTTTAGSILYAFSNGIIIFDRMDFGACPAPYSQITASDGGRVNSVLGTGTYIISAGAVSHVHAYGQGGIVIGYTIVTLTGTPAFSSYFAGVAGAYINFEGCTFSGSATGSRYTVHKNGLLNTQGQATTWLPGDTAGTIATGGQYT